MSNGIKLIDILISYESFKICKNCNAIEEKRNIACKKCNSKDFKASPLNIGSAVDDLFEEGVSLGMDETELAYDLNTKKLIKQD